MVILSGGDKMAKGKPKKDSSGRGTRANRGRGGCKTTKKTGQGRKGAPPARRRRTTKPPGRGRNRR